MVEKPKLCIDCRHHVLAVSEVGVLMWRRTKVEHRCMRPLPDKVSLVTGARCPQTTDLSCEDERAYFAGTDCHPDGRLWEPRP